MRPSHRRAGLAFAAAGAVALACSSGGRAPVSVSVAPTLLFPQDVLQNAKSVGLTVYDQTKGVTCNGAIGQAGGVSAATPKVTSATLGACPAASTAKFCGTLVITESADTLVFAATALDASGTAIAYGCAASIVNAATLSLSITMIPSAPTPVCGNGVIEATEQCDPPPAAGTTDAVCDSQCHSQEQILSTGTTTPEGPAFALWPAKGELLTFFADADPGGTGSADIALRVMSDALEPVANPPALASAILAPNDLTGALPPLPAPGAQSQPSAAEILGTYFYVFTDDSFGSPAIHMRSFDDTSFAGQQPQAAPIVIDGPDAGPVVTPDAGNGGADGGGEGGAEAGANNGPDAGGVPVQSTSPAVAANGTGSLFVAWQDVSGPTAGQILGRTYTPTGGALGPVIAISAASTTNEGVRVAGTATGFVVVWADAAQIKLRVLSGNGTPAGPESVVSGGSHTQDHPDVAVLSDGRLAVVWADHGTAQGADIFVQRYDANYVPVTGDQTAPINDLLGPGDQVSPAIAGTTAAGGSFIVAWLDVTSGDVRGRVLDGTKGFAQNPEDGTMSEFKASLSPGIPRENPFVVVGGAGPWAAIGWDVGGVVTVRRFPTVTETPQ